MYDDEEAMNRMREVLEARDAREQERQWERLRQLERKVAAAGGAERREMELCRVPLPVKAETFSRLASAIAMEFEGATVRQDDDELVVVAPVLEGRTANTPEVAQ